MLHPIFSECITKDNVPRNSHLSRMFSESLLDDESSDAQTPLQRIFLFRMRFSDGLKKQLLLFLCEAWYLLFSYTLRKHSIQDPRWGPCKSTDHRTRPIPTSTLTFPQISHPTELVSWLSESGRLINFRGLTRVTSAGHRCLASWAGWNIGTGGNEPDFEEQVVFNAARSQSKI